MAIVTLFMTSRSGSSMVADIFRRHGFFWSRDETANPLVGGRKVRYHSFENQTIKAFNRQAFGTPLGEYITFDDAHLRAFRALLVHEYGKQDRAVWKGAVEFFPLWQAVSPSWEHVHPCVIWREPAAVMDSLRAKRRGSVDEGKLMKITMARYELLGELAGEYGFPVIETDSLVQGDYSSLKQAFDHWGYQMDEDIVKQTIQPSKWETDR